MLERAFFTLFGVFWIAAALNRSTLLGPPFSKRRELMYARTKAQRIILLMFGIALIGRGLLGWFSR